MHTRVQQRVLYSESAQVRLGEGRGRFDDNKIRVGPAYQAVIPALGSWGSRADETARAGVEMARTKQTASFRRHEQAIAAAAEEASRRPPRPRLPPPLTPTRSCHS